MKKLFIFLLSVIAISVQAQESSRFPPLGKDGIKLVNEAIARGKNSDGCYCVTNPKNKQIAVEQVFYYLCNHNYYLTEAIEKPVSKYGQIQYAFSKVCFTDYEGYKKFAFDKFKGDKYRNVSFRQLKEGGTFFYTAQNTRGEFMDTCRVDGVAWSGKMVDGLLDGKGIGIYPSGKAYIIFEGDFIAGIPLAQIKATRTDKEVIILGGYRMGDNGKDQPEERKRLVFSSWSKVSSPKLKQALLHNIRLYYRDDCSEIQDAYNKALVLNTVTYKRYDLEIKRSFYTSNTKKTYKLYIDYDRIVPGSNLYIYNNVGSIDFFISKYEGKDVDSLSLIPKAKELLELYNVLEVRCRGFRPSADYLTHNIWGVAKYDETRVNAEIKLYFEALEIVKTKSQDPTSSFRAFYSKMRPEFVENENFFRNEYKRIAFKRYMSAENREMEVKCDKCKVDGKQTTFPKGYVEKYVGLFFDRPAQSEKEGYIRMHNGDVASWKYIYENGKTYIEANGVKYDSVDEMLEDLVESCRKKYCQ